MIIAVAGLALFSGCGTLIRHWLYNIDNPGVTRHLPEAWREQFTGVLPH